MLRKLIILGIFTGSAASVPVLIEKNPQLFERTERAVAPAAMPVVAKAPAMNGRKVKVAVDESGHFIGAFTINGRRVDAIVDTGATQIAINRSTARRLGLQLTKADFRYEVRTANGIARAAGVMLDAVEIGGIRVNQVAAMVLEDSALGQTLVGMSFLTKLDRFAVEDGALILEQ